jgi:hypothetical protein
MFLNSLQLLLPSTDRRNQTELAMVSILPKQKQNKNKTNFPERPKGLHTGFFDILYNYS